MTAEPKQVDERLAWILEMCRNLRVRYEQGALGIWLSSLDELADAVTRLVEAIMRVSGLWYTFKEAHYRMTLKYGEVFRLSA